MRRILVTGKRGQLGSALVGALAGSADVIAIGREEVDFAKPYALRAFVRALPELRWIINAAAYTDVDKAEDDRQSAERVNSDAPAVLAEEAQRRDVPIIHFSTDYVFDGRKGAPYTEEDEVRPLSIYGSTKLAGERAVRTVNANHLILRLSWVYGLGGRSFLETMRRLAEQGTTPRVVDDQWGTPTWRGAVVDAVLRMMATCERAAEAVPWGTYHVAGPGVASRHDFADLALHLLATMGHIRSIAPERVRSEEFPTRAQRPPFSALLAARLETTFGIVLPCWEDQLARCLREER